jgi:hypothetical protein
MENTEPQYDCPDWHTLNHKYTIDPYGDNRMDFFDRKGAVGFITWSMDDGEVEKIHVGDKCRRKGLGRHIWNTSTEYSEDNRLPTPKHSSRRSYLGDEFAKGIGGHIPSLTDDIDGWSSQKFMENDEDNLKIKSPLEILQKVAIEHNMPTPTTFLDSGSSATIFNTTNPNIVARISEKGECEKTMYEPHFQESKGVVKILLLITNDNYIISFKEKVNILYEQIIKRLYPKNGKEIIQILDNLYYYFYFYKPEEDPIPFLKKFKSTKYLAEAIEMGLPTSDLGGDNLGITKDNRIVAIDC